MRWLWARPRAVRPLRTPTSAASSYRTEQSSVAEQPLLAGVLSAVALGIGTAMVYPALIAAVSDHAHPTWRPNALGTYRFWRDIGYAAGALIAGILADAFGLNAAVIAAAVLTAGSGLLAARWITEHHPYRPQTTEPE